jgi:hypothetical protein
MPEVPLALQRQQICASQRVKPSKSNAVSALTARCPLMMGFRRWNGMFIRRAASTRETSSGSRNSLDGISPGWVGGR